MRLRFNGFVASLVSISLGLLPAQAQSDVQVGNLVEALRQAALQSGIKGNDLHSDWQVKSENIPRWSKRCTGKELSPQEFEASPVTARGILVCVVRDVFRDEYRLSKNSESLAVRRTAAWWMTGDPAQYSTVKTAPYTQKVLGLYQQSKLAATATMASPQPSQNTAYDRYMTTAYDATLKKNYSTALLYFKRALDERPDDSYAAQAIRNVEAYQTKRPVTSTPTPTTATSTAATALTQQQAVGLVTQWLQAKPEIFAPPFNQQRASELTTGELYGALIKPGGVMTWLKNNQAYYRYGVQKIESVERFVASNDRATIEIKLTEDRTLYRNGAIDASQTNFAQQQIRYSLELQEGRWKVADYKTIDGLLLERAILTTTTSKRQ